MTRAAVLLLCPATVWAHVMSMSTGDLRVEGSRAYYELRMPLYELMHTKSPETSLLGAIRFVSAGEPARVTRSSCREEAGAGNYVCSAEYEFSAPVGRLDVECTFHSVTVPNHVHLLRAVRGDKRDQAIFDFSFPRAEIRFDPPTPFETAMRQTAAGMVRAAGGWVQILFLAALVLAARSRREQLALLGMFLLGQVASAVITPRTGWQPAPRFVEAAMALTIAYLAVEVLALPQAGQRWLVAGVLGAFHGLYFALFIQSSEFRPQWVLSGAAFVEIALVALLAFGFSRLRRAIPSPRLVQAPSALLLVVGLGWFFVRLRS